MLSRRLLQKPDVPTRIGRDPCPRPHRALRDCQIFIRKYQFLINFQFCPQTRASRTSAVRTIERKIPRFNLHYIYSAFGTGESFGQHQILLRVGPMNNHRSLAQFQGCFQRFEKPRSVLRINIEPVNHHFNIVFFLFVHFQIQRFFNRIRHPVKTDAGISGFLELGQQIFMFAFLIPDQWRQKNNGRIFRQSQNALGNLISGLPFYLGAAIGAMRPADSREKKPKIIVNFRHRAHG